MNLVFSRTFPKGHSKEGEPTYFVTRIRAKTKIHTVRFGDKWKDDTILHLWDNNPRFKLSHPKRFDFINWDDSLGERFARDITKTDEQDAHYYCPLSTIENGSIEFDLSKDPHDMIITIEGTVLDPWEITSLANNDGLLLEDFVEWMYNGAINWMKKNNLGHETKIKVAAPLQIVHWTGKRYVRALALKVEDNGKA